MRYVELEETSTADDDNNARWSSLWRTFQLHQRGERGGREERRQQKLEILAMWLFYISLEIYFAIFFHFALCRVESWVEHVLNSFCRFICFRESFRDQLWEVADRSISRISSFFFFSLVCKQNVDFVTFRGKHNIKTEWSFEFFFVFICKIAHLSFLWVCINVKSAEQEKQGGEVNNKLSTHQLIKSH